jgi:hypothetical protein
MSEVFDIINKERFAWLVGFTKMIEKKHSGVNYGYETEDNTWRIFTRNGTLIIKIGFDLKNNYITYDYLVELNKKLSLSSEKTKNLKDLNSIISKLEDINAFEK